MKQNKITNFVFSLLEDIEIAISLKPEELKNLADAPNEFRNWINYNLMEVGK